jgi:hypothetical protein
LFGPISEQPHNSIKTIDSDALVITRIVAPITAHPETPHAVFVTRITTETPRHRHAALWWQSLDPGYFPPSESAAGSSKNASNSGVFSSPAERAT